MPHARVWYEPDGQFRVTVFASPDDAATVASANATLIADGRVHPDSTFDDVSDDATLQALFPADQSQRDKWRYKGPGIGIVVDHTVPDPVDPKQDLIDQVKDAKTIDDLKAVIQALITRR